MSRKWGIIPPPNSMVNSTPCSRTLLPFSLGLDKGYAARTVNTILSRVPTAVISIVFFMATISCPSSIRFRYVSVLKSTGHRNTSPAEIALLPLKEMAIIFRNGNTVAAANSASTMLLSQWNRLVLLKPLVLMGPSPPFLSGLPQPAFSHGFDQPVDTDHQD
ncbi:hypothetical protein D3C75_777240 [compost metagenome]